MQQSSMSKSVWLPQRRYTRIHCSFLYTLTHLILTSVQARVTFGSGTRSIHRAEKVCTCRFLLIDTDHCEPGVGLGTSGISGGSSGNATMAPKLPGLVKSNSANAQREESIYRMAPFDPFACAPVVKTYNIQPSSPKASSAGLLPKMHADSSQVQSILHPVQGPRDVQVRAGIKPPNHSKSNIAAVKELSSLNNLRKVAEQQQSRVSGSGGPAGAASRSTSAPQRRPQPRQPSNDGRDFVRENRAGAAAPSRPPRAEAKQDDGMKYLQKRDFGRVPTYLLERKLEMVEKQEADIRAKEAALIPPGMRLLPEDERLETLAILQRNRQEIERAMQALPIVIETPSQIRRRDDLEQRLRDIEEGLKVFARQKVLVRL